MTEWTAIDRARLAELCREQDELMARASSPVHETEPVLYRSFNGNALAATSEFDTAPSDGDDELLRAIDRFADAIEHRIVEFEHELVTRDARIAKLETQVETLLQLLGQQSRKLWTPP